VLDALVDVDPDALAGRDEVVALSRQLTRLEAVAARASAAFERTRAWEADGARTPSAWLASRCRVPEHVVRRRLQAGRVLPELPTVETAWLAGDVPSGAVEQLAAARNDTTAAQLRADEPELVRFAARLHPKAFARLVGHWRAGADPDGVEDDARRLHDHRRVHLSSTFEGAWVLDGVLDPVGGEIVAGALQGIGQELFRSDWAEARAAHGDAATADRLARTPAQRRADALVELARRAVASPTGATPARPLFTVVVDRPTFGRVCELARSRTAVAPGALVPWLHEAEVQRVVFDPADRVLGVGAKRRLFTGADRRAVEVRDGECTSPFCAVPAEDCEVDHVVPFAEGGPTTPDNGRLACGFHNRSRPGAQRPEPPEPPEPPEEDERGPP
jgi:hypothetical protein